MQKKHWAGFLGLLAIAFTTGALVAQPISRLTIQFTEMDPHIGQKLEARLLEADSGIEIAHRILDEVPASEFEIQFLGAQVGATYRIEVYTDHNGNGMYDDPPSDHAWQRSVTMTEEVMEFVFPHTVEFTELTWPEPSGEPAIDGQVVPGEYTRSLTEPATGMRVLWRNDAETLVMAMIAPGVGWVSVGLDPEDAMQGADYILAAVRDGALVIEDHFGTGRFRHTKDSQQDILEAAGTEDESHTIVEFRLALDSGDEADKALTPGETYPLLVAFHATSDNLSARHTHRAATELTLD